MPSRGLIGFHTEFLTATSGTGILHHVFDHYGPKKADIKNGRSRGVLISKATGKAAGYSLFNLQARGQMFIPPNTDVYEGMIVGLHARDNDLVINVNKGKQLTNVRASGTDENIVLTPPIIHSLEEALEFINDDELVEVTPESIRLRKKVLNESFRKRT
jgi:GTP-binding protein